MVPNRSKEPLTVFRTVRQEQSLSSQRECVQIPGAPAHPECQRTGYRGHLDISDLWLCSEGGRGSSPESVLWPEGEGECRSTKNKSFLYYPEFLYYEVEFRRSRSSPAEDLLKNIRTKRRVSVIIIHISVTKLTLISEPLSLTVWLEIVFDPDVVVLAANHWKGF